MENKMLEQMKEKYPEVNESDFWLLEEKTWILKHTGCLKIASKEGIILNPSCYEVYFDDHHGNIVLFYNDKEQNIFEISEVSVMNYTGKYPYLIALKRLQDRVILKLSKLAEQGYYSEVEVDEFQSNQNSGQNGFNKIDPKVALITKIKDLGNELLVTEYCKKEFKKYDILELNEFELQKVLKLLGGSE